MNDLLKEAVEFGEDFQSLLTQVREFRRDLVDRASEIQEWSRNMAERASELSEFSDEDTGNFSAAISGSVSESVGNALDEIHQIEREFALLALKGKQAHDTPENEGPGFSELAEQLDGFSEVVEMLDGFSNGPEEGAD